jgi:hypothetical protein
VLAATAVALVLSTAACGGGKSSSSTTTTTAQNSDVSTWANSVCSAFVTWKSSVTAAGKSVAANPTKASVDQGIASAEAATATLKTTLHGLKGKAPTTSAAADAQTALQQLNGQLQNDIAVIKRTVSGVPAGAVGASQAASAVKTALVTMRSQITETGKTLRSLPTGEVEQAFENAPACKSL